MSQILVIGMGSIGERHARLLQEASHTVHCVTSRVDVDYARHKTIKEALKTDQFDLVLISSETHRHEKDLQQVLQAGFQNRILIEKPIFSSTQLQTQIIAKEHIFVGYQLRFHALLRQVRALIQNRRVYTVNCRVGQHLSTWRSKPYQESYSADSRRGGGVLRDLSHELDYISWLFGDFAEVIGTIRNTGELEISSEDLVLALARTKKDVNVSIELNYLSRIPTREISILGDKLSIKLDFISGRLIYRDSDKTIDETIEVNRDLAFRDMHKAALSGESSLICAFEQAMHVVRTCEAIERSAQNHRWEAV